MLSIKIDFGVFAILYLFVQPLYLLFVNLYFICKKNIPYFNSIICMTSVVVFNVLYTIVIHKIQTGYFIGDVPEGIYLMMLGIPISIIVIGIIVMIFLKK